MDDNGANDVGSNQELETQENRSPQILPAHAIGAKRVAMPPIEKASDCDECSDNHDGDTGGINRGAHQVIDSRNFSIGAPDAYL